MGESIPPLNETIITLRHHSMISALHFEGPETTSRVPPNLFQMIASSVTKACCQTILPSYSHLGAIHPRYATLSLTNHRPTDGFTPRELTATLIKWTRRQPLTRPCSTTPRILCRPELFVELHVARIPAVPPACQGELRPAVHCKPPDTKENFAPLYGSSISGE